MQNVIITSGGTTEYIDTIRKITNRSSGKLGSIISDTLNSPGRHIFYIYTKGALHPTKTLNLTEIPVETTEEVQDAIIRLFLDYKIDWFIHAMAISDYTVDYVTNADMLYENLQENGLSIDSIINNTHTLDRKKKLSSNEDNLIIKLKKTPKIIGMIKKMQSSTHLVGFKLLSHSTKAELIAAAEQLLLKNNCDFVVANDLKDISFDKHKAIIVTPNKYIRGLETKEDIAEYIKEKVDATNK